MNSKAVDDQSEIFAFLGDPATYNLDRPVIRIDTHGACVFLAGGDVYKVKRAVRFDYMDFSTLEKRRLACKNEIAVNKANAPELYLGTVAITRAQGQLRLGEPGEVVEWAVHLRRFDENSTLDRLAERGEFGIDIIPRLTAVILESHRRPSVRDGVAATAAVQTQAEDTLTDLARATDVFPAERVGAFRDAVTSRFEALEPLLLRRGEYGQVRHCHGDLHLRNIALIDGQPVLFDAIEFDETIATCDVLYDLAFLLMDLWDRGLVRQANLLMNRYFWSTEDQDLQLEGLAALPVFMSLRAAIRAKVAVALATLSTENQEAAVADARRFFEVASDFLTARSLHLVGVGGLSGTGKSTLAGELAPFIGRAPGAVHLRSDIERKRAFSVREFESLPAAAYAPEVSPTIYGRLRHLAELALHAGQSVVVDAVQGRKEERDALANIASGVGASFTGLWLHAPVEILTRRVAARSSDASDATPAVVRAQAQQSVGHVTWHQLDATWPQEDVTRGALELCEGATTAVSLVEPRPLQAGGTGTPKHSER